MSQFTMEVKIWLKIRSEKLVHCFMEIFHAVQVPVLSLQKESQIRFVLWLESAFSFSREINSG